MEEMNENLKKRKKKREKKIISLCFRYLKPDRDKKSKFKTAVKKKTLNPEYHEVRILLRYKFDCKGF